MGHIFGSRVDTSESVPRLFPRHFGDGLCVGTRRSILIPFRTSEGSRGQSFCFSEPADTPKKTHAIQKQSLACYPARTENVSCLSVSGWTNFLPSTKSQTVCARQLPFSFSEKGDPPEGIPL